MSWQEQDLYKLVVIAKQKRHARFGSIQNKTQRVCQVGEKKKGKSVGNKQTKPWIWFGAFPWTQVSISKCIFQARRCFHGEEVFCSIFAWPGHHMVFKYLGGPHTSSWGTGVRAAPGSPAGMLSAVFCPYSDCVLWWVMKPHSFGRGPLLVLHFGSSL